jgi:hypothetical protein
MQLIFDLFWLGLGLQVATPTSLPQRCFLSIWVRFSDIGSILARWAHIGISRIQGALAKFYRHILRVLAKYWLATFLTPCLDKRQIIGSPNCIQSSFYSDTLSLSRHTLSYASPTTTYPNTSFSRAPQQVKNVYVTSRSYAQLGRPHLSSDLHNLCSSV